MKVIVYYIFRILVWYTGLLSDTRLYTLSDRMHFLIYRVFSYRKKTVLDNLSKSFPKKTNEEIHTLAKQYYRNLCDLILETLASYSWSLEKIESKFHYTNTEILHRYTAIHQSLVGVASHSGNFEFGAVLIARQLKINVYSIYSTMANPYIDKYIYKKRTRAGTQIASSKEIAQFISTFKPPYMFVLIADQNPSKINKAYWVNFLHQDTAFVHGPSSMAQQLKTPIIYFDIQRVKRGYYTCELSELVDDPTLYSNEEITKKIAQKLETALISRPDDWLWSHKRWKWQRVNGQPVRVA